MCGIGGFVSKALTRQHLDKMTCTLQHRGPDAEGIYFNEEQGIGLGHRRLSIIDLSEAANQPFYSADRRYVVVYNGEIYNFKELKAKYRLRTKTTSDTEVVVELLAQYGVDILPEFNGMFSLAMWDTQNEELLLIRDRIGKKPLLYYHHNDEIIFSSELKTFFSLPLSWSVNREALKDFLFLEYVPGNHSIIESINKLPPGHYLKFKNGEKTVTPYYNILEAINPDKKKEISSADHRNVFYEVLSSSVKYRQISDVPLGAFLSGGTDSSLICAVLQEQSSQPVNTFTIGFDVAKFDETKYANEVADVLHTNQRVFHLTDTDSLGIVDNLVKYYDEPFSAPSCIPSYLVCNKAKEHVTVAMSGDGGDELFMGYGYYNLYKKLKSIYNKVPAIGRELLSKLLYMRGGKYERGSRLFQLKHDDGLLVRIWAEEQYMFKEEEISELFGEKYTHKSLIPSWQNINSMPIDDFEKISLFDYTQYLSNNLMYKMDSASMANSLEVRNPYLDYRLVELAMNMPLSCKINNGEQKYLMKKLLERYLPKHLVYRYKWGFPAPIGEWLYKDLRHLPDVWLSEDRIRQQGIFDPKAVSKWVASFRQGKQYHYKRIWSLIIFQMWYKEYMEDNAN